jgi:hypothetical protein
MAFMFKKPSISLRYETKNPNLIEYQAYIKICMARILQRMQAKNDVDYQIFRAKTKAAKQIYLEEIAKKEIKELARKLALADEASKESYLEVLSKEFSDDRAKAERLVAELTFVDRNAGFQEKSPNIKKTLPETIDSKRDAPETVERKQFFLSFSQKGAKYEEKKTELTIPPEGKLTDEEESYLLKKHQKYEDIETKEKKQTTIFSIIFTTSVLTNIWLLSINAASSKSFLEFAVYYLAAVGIGITGFILILKNIESYTNLKVKIDGLKEEIEKRLNKSKELKEDIEPEVQEQPEGGLGR